MSRWLITGATGLLGSNAAVVLGERHHVVATARKQPVGFTRDFIASDIGDVTDRGRLILESSPTVVLHSAAIASIEACESDPERAKEINVTAPADLARRAQDAGASFIYISTDAVFDGARGNYTEDDAPSPASEYGRTKLAGEREVLSANPDALVARVNFYGWSPSGRRSLAEFFFNRLSRGESAPGFEDTVVSTLYVDYLVEYLEQLVQVKATGVVHVASSQATSKYEFGQRLASTFGFEPDLVIPAQSSDHLSVRRGSALALDTGRLRSLLAHDVADQHAGMERLLAAYADGRPRRVKEFETERMV